MRGRVTSSVFIIAALVIAVALRALEAWAPLAVLIARQTDVEIITRHWQAWPLVGELVPFGIERMRLFLVLMIGVAFVGALRSRPALIVLPVLAVATISTEWFRVMTVFGEPSGTHCGPEIHVRNEHDFAELRFFALSMACIVGAKWVLTHRRKARAVPSLLAASIVGMFVCSDLKVIVLFACIALLMNRAPHLVSRGATALTAMLAALASIPAMSIAHDLGVELPRHDVMLRSDALGSVIPIAHCLAPLPAIGWREMELGASTVQQALADQRKVVEQEGGVYRPTVNAYRDQLWERVRALENHRAERPLVQLLEPQLSPAGLWTVDAVHLHACALRFEVAADGAPLSRFGSVEALIRAADANGGTLSVRP